MTKDKKKIVHDNLFLGQYLLCVVRHVLAGRVRHSVPHGRHFLRRQRLPVPAAERGQRRRGDHPATILNSKNDDLKISDFNEILNLPSTICISVKNRKSIICLLLTTMKPKSNFLLGIIKTNPYLMYYYVILFNLRINV